MQRVSNVLHEHKQETTKARTSENACLRFGVRRVDIIEDCGRSMNPYIDIGQVEGAFIMGLGLYTSEIVKYDTNTGQKLSNSTWEYKPPTALDIPVDLRVTLLPNASNPHGVLGSKGRNTHVL
nr:probable aldehyde oxidase gad-3 [Cherax quadricarinatus]